MFVFSKSRLGMWYKLHRYNWSRKEREPSCQQCLLTVLMAPCSHEWTWGQRDMWELMVLSLDLGLKLKTKTGIPWQHRCTWVYDGKTEMRQVSLVRCKMDLLLVEQAAVRRSGSLTMPRSTWLQALYVYKQGTQTRIIKCMCQHEVAKVTG